MSKNWSLDDIDFSKAIEDIPSQDPEKSLRYNLPVPNWLDEKGEPTVSHAFIRQKEDGSWRFYFYNYKDKCDQGVKIDGSSVITFMGANPATAQKLTSLIKEYASDPEELSPEQMSDILERAHSEIGLGDRYNNGRKSVSAYMHPYTAENEYFGEFLPKPVLSTAVYLQGSGVFMDGPTASPQTFENDAFISFPGQPKEKILAMTPAELRANKDFTVKLVQADVFVNSRTYKDGSEIKTESLPRQKEVISDLSPDRPLKLEP